MRLPKKKKMFNAAGVAGICEIETTFPFTHLQIDMKIIFPGASYP